MSDQKAKSEIYNKPVSVCFIAPRDWFQSSFRAITRSYHKWLISARRWSSWVNSSLTLEISWPSLWQIWLTVPSNSLIPIKLECYFFVTFLPSAYMTTSQVQSPAHFRVDELVECAWWWPGQFCHLARLALPIELKQCFGYYSRGYRVMTFLNAHIFPLFTSVPFPVLETWKLARF